MDVIDNLHVVNFIFCSLQWHVGFTAFYVVFLLLFTGLMSKWIIDGMDFYAFDGIANI